MEVEVEIVQHCQRPTADADRPVGRLSQRMQRRLERLGRTLSLDTLDSHGSFDRRRQSSAALLGTE